MNQIKCISEYEKGCYPHHRTEAAVGGGALAIGRAEVGGKGSLGVYGIGVRYGNSLANIDSLPPILKD